MWKFLLFLATLGFIIHKVMEKKFGYWKIKKVPSTPVLMIFKNYFELLFLRKSIGEVYCNIYDKYSGMKYVGIYKANNPAILVRDPDIIQDIFIKEFNSFHDNDVFIDDAIDPIFGKNPFCLKGDRWKVCKKQLSPCYSINKYKSMFPLIQAVGKNMVKFIHDLGEVSRKDGIETKELASKFTVDVVASCAFGLEGKSFMEDQTQFQELRKIFLTPSPLVAIQSLCVLLIPWLANVLDVKFYPDDTLNYFRNIVHDTLKYRAEGNVTRGDFLDIMKELKEQSLDGEFTNDDIVAHSAGFFADGFETSSNTLTYALFELAANPVIQSHLRNEIDKFLEQSNGKLTCDGLESVEYLDNVVHESLRKYSVNPSITRTCTKEYTFPPVIDDIKSPNLTINPGMPVVIPVYAIHKDAKYYPNPEKFDPDRFSKENRNNMVKCIFLGFGEGPRKCLGMKFAIGQVKVALASIISNFEIRLNKKTVVPLKFNPQSFLLTPKAGVWLDYYKLH